MAWCGRSVGGVSAHGADDGGRDRFNAAGVVPVAAHVVDVDETIAVAQSDIAQADAGRCRASAIRSPSWIVTLAPAAAVTTARRPGRVARDGDY